MQEAVRSIVSRLFRALATLALIVAILLSGCASPTPALPPLDGRGSGPTVTAQATDVATQRPLPTQTPLPTATATTVPSPTPDPTATPQPLVLALAPGVSEGMRIALEGADLVLPDGRQICVVGPESSVARDALLRMARLDEARVAAEEDGTVLVQERVYAVVAPFDSLRDDLSLAELEARWAADGDAPLLTSADTLVELTESLGAPGIEPLPSDDELLARLASDPDAVGILPFDALDPRFKVLALDGQNPLSNQFEPRGYPLAVGVILEGEREAKVAEALRSVLGGDTNRDPDRLTQLVMTGVTAMTRLTADRMETYGYTYPAEVISDVLRAADITHVSNEVPFIEGCVLNTTSGNLIMCSDYPYWEALEAIGTDIVGLSGNHVNDFGRQGALESLAFYRERDIPIYGSGRNLEEACAPLIAQDHGNTFAFLAALAWEPASAWATADQPGACPFYQEKERILETIRGLAADPKVDIVAVELQYLETYNAFPTAQQVDEFRELRSAGADIVTGVQSHVPQSWEPYGADDPGGHGIIVYGLGNLFFDQMWSWETRTGLIARHTIYDGRVISCEILTTVLEDFAQPRWATPDERAEILARIHAAAPSRP
jgi:hypothetical protein